MLQSYITQEIVSPYVVTCEQSLSSLFCLQATLHSISTGPYRSGVYRPLKLCSYCAVVNRQHPSLLLWMPPAFTFYTGHA